VYQQIADVVNLTAPIFS